MKQYFKSVISLSVLVLSLSILPHMAKALGDPGEDPDAPIDGGVGILIAAGVGFGIKKIRDERKNKLKKLS